jgi:predicted nucleotidyltransferase
MLLEMSELDEAEVQMLKNVVGGHGELIFAQRSGSSSFNLSLPTSDKDYFGVFVAHDPLDIKAETFDHSVQGNTGDDWVVYELGKYLELLAKGNPKVVEPLFASHLVWTTPLWLQIVDAFRPMVVNMTTVCQYLSFASFEYQSAVKKKEKVPDATLKSHGKPFYHAFRLTREAKRMLEGLPPRVWWEGAEREELMAIRTGETTETFDQVAARAKSELEATKALRKQSTVPESLDMVKSGDWLVKVRLPVLKARAKEAQFIASPSESEFDDDVTSIPSPFADLTLRTRHLLAEHGLSKAKVLKIVPIGAQLMQKLLRAGAPVSGSSDETLNSTGTIDQANASSVSNSQACLREEGAVGADWHSESRRNCGAARSEPDATTLDWLVVYKLPAADIVNPLKQVSPFYFEAPQKLNVTGGSKYGCGIWAVEIESAISNLSRHHVVFEALVALPNDARCKESWQWQHGEWLAYEQMLKTLWSDGSIVTFGLVSHYLGVITGLLRSSLVWTTESEKGNGSGKLKQKATGSEDAPVVGSGGVSELGDQVSGPADPAATPQPPASSDAMVAAPSMASDPWPMATMQSKAYRLALRLYHQALCLLPSSPAVASALSSGDQRPASSRPQLLPSETSHFVLAKVSEATASASAMAAARDALLSDVVATQTSLKRLALPTDLPKAHKAALARQLRRSRDATLDWV